MFIANSFSRASLDGTNFRRACDFQACDFLVGFLTRPVPPGEWDTIYARSRLPDDDVQAKSGVPSPTEEQTCGPILFAAVAFTAALCATVVPTPAADGAQEPGKTPGKNSRPDLKGQWTGAGSRPWARVARESAGWS
jgi:hypothetical protein